MKSVDVLKIYCFFPALPGDKSMVSKKGVDTWRVWGRATLVFRQALNNAPNATPLRNNLPFT